MGNEMDKPHPNHGCYIGLFFTSNCAEIFSLKTNDNKVADWATFYHHDE